MKNLLIILSLLVFASTLQYSQIINVPTDQSTIQAGIDAATNGDTVLVAEGKYYENINFKGKAITVASQFYLDHDTSHISKTIIDGSKPTNPNKASVVTLESGEDTNSVICGFTITGGKGTLFSANNNKFGGGIYCYLSSARIEHNIIEFNEITNTWAQGGGGIGAINSSFNSNLMYVIIDHNTIRNNNCKATGTRAMGGGIYLECKGRIIDNDILNNTVEYTGLSTDNAGSYGGGISFGWWGGGYLPVKIYDNTITNNKVLGTIMNTYGGGLDIILADLDCRRNIIKFNQASAGGGLRVISSKGHIKGNDFFKNSSIAGGGILTNNSNSLIEMNTFFNNYADTTSGGICVAGNSNPEIKNNLIVNNEAFAAGGIGIYVNSNPKVINNTITKNKAIYGGGFDFQFNCKPVIMNSIIYGNTADSSGNNIFLSDSTNVIAFAYCDVEGGIADFGIYENAFSFSGTYENNIDYDPLFADDSLFKLADGSPCIDAGNPDPIYNDDDGSRNDIGYIGGSTPTGVKENVRLSSEVPSDFKLYQNYPNPFNPTTTIKYSIPASLNPSKGGTLVQLKIYDILGREIAVLVNEEQKPGYYEVKWNGRNMPSGVYFYGIKAGRFIQTKKMILLR